MSKYHLLIAFLITLFSVGGGMAAYAAWWDDYFVHCWKEEEHTGIIYCRESFYVCPSTYLQGYPPPPIQCP
jgi:hypothetical protein